jgi:hypothetical protein
LLSFRAPPVLACSPPLLVLPLLAGPALASALPEALHALPATDSPSPAATSTARFNQVDCVECVMRPSDARRPW